MLGIIGAMDEEVAKVKEEMKKVTVMTRASMDFFEGEIEGHPVVVVRSGIGKVNAAMCTQILADVYHVDAIINTGIAGSLNAEIDIGDIVLSTDTLEHDMDAVAFGYPLGQIPRMDTLSFAADGKLRELAKKVCREVNPEVKVFEGRIVSGDQFVSDKVKKQWLVEHFSGYCTEMEGAAIAHAAYLNRIPFLIIRAISDKADDSATMDYPTFEAKAIEHSVKLLLALCRQMQ
ncbi:MAG: 5'-methylthioadenosine/adenosylhomocysteine nucleosidase [Bacteroidales bacterium]|nr:5'-methylthioadenosine/adenosylhomocysteine nucleosidase [Clostridium sp.]MCM1204880.1 5'-methylthioadenosine/adenosylhomocysteine nucleosidase [Bacteroidales bacterium]